MKRDSKFYSRISKMRKVKSGGKSFIDPEFARLAQRKSVESRHANKEKSLRNLPDKMGNNLGTR